MRIIRALEWVTGIIIIVFSVVYVLGWLPSMSKYLAGLKKSKAELMGTESIKLLKVYQDRDIRIQRMERTLTTHYELSWYEAHYYSIIFDDYAQKYKAPWQIFPAILRIESNFDPTVRSQRDAKGIAQVLEPTAKELCGKLNIKYENSKTLWNEILNLCIGFTYLGEGIQQMGMERGVQRYIGGPGFNKGRKDVGDYRTTVRMEFIRLTYIYRGLIESDSIHLDSPEKIFDDDTTGDLSGNDTGFSNQDTVLK